MEGSSNLFQLDDDDIFNSDSFLEELEHVENVEKAHIKSSKVDQQGTSSNESNSIGRFSALGALTNNGSTPQATTPGTRKFSFKSKTSPEIPLPSSAFRNQPRLCAEARTILNPDFHASNTNSHSGKTVSGDSGRGLRGITGSQTGVNKMPSAATAMRPLPTKPTAPGNTNQSTKISASNVVMGTAAHSNEPGIQATSTALRTPVQAQPQNPTTRLSPEFTGFLHSQNAQHKRSPGQSQIGSNLSSFSNSSIRGTARRSSESSNQSSGTPNEGGSFSGGVNPRGSMNAPHNTSHMRPGREVALRSPENNTQGNLGKRMPMNTGGSFSKGMNQKSVNMPTNAPQMRPGNETALRSTTGNSIQGRGPANAGGGINSGVNQRSMNMPTNTPQMRPGNETTLRSAGSNTHSRGPANGGGGMNSGVNQRSMNMPTNTPQMRPGNETSLRSAGSNIHGKGPANAGGGMNSRDNQRGLNAPLRTPQARPMGGYSPQTSNYSARSNTPTGNQPSGRTVQPNQSPAPLPQSRGRPVPGMGGNASTRPPHRVAMPRPGPTPPRQSPGQGRTVLTPRVAQLCQGSGPSPGAGAHGGTRKFPGPAGLLPKLTPGEKMKTSPEAVQTQLSEIEPVPDTQEDGDAEETVVGDFEHGAWQMMKRELGLRDGDPNSILNQNSIALVIRKASLKQLARHKVSHLCVMVKLISLNSRDASVTLCDPSGEMQGTIHRRLVEDHQAELKPGSVLVLRQIGVLSPSQRNHYLNITPSNLVQVFPPDGGSKSFSQKTPKRGPKTSPTTPGRVPVTPKATPKNNTPGARGVKSPQEAEGVLEKDPEAWATDFDDIQDDLFKEDSPQMSHRPNIKPGQSSSHSVPIDTTKTPNANVPQGRNHSAGASSNSRHPSGGTCQQQNLVTSARNSKPNTSTPISSRTSSSTLRPASARGGFSREPVSMNTPATLSSNKSPFYNNSSSENIPQTGKRSSAATKGSPLCLDETKRACLTDISGQETNVCFIQKGGLSSPAAFTPAGHQEENISDLLDGLEDELFDDF